MRYKITRFQTSILKWIARKIVIQSHRHKTNIITYYRVLADAARDEFREDNGITLNSFLIECHSESLLSSQQAVEGGRAEVCSECGSTDVETELHCARCWAAL